MAFSRDARHTSPPWPDGYWPDGDGPPTSTARIESIKAFRHDRKAMIERISDPHADLLAPLPHGQRQTLAREAMLLDDHCGYPIGQLILLRRMLGCWPE